MHAPINSHPGNKGAKWHWRGLGSITCAKTSFEKSLLQTQNPVGNLEAENFLSEPFSVLKGADPQASITFDLRPWNKLTKLSDSTGVVGV